MCNRCGVEKQLSDMKKDKRYADGYSTLCKKCHRLPSQGLRASKTSMSKWPAGHRPCRQCNNMLPLSDFGKNKTLPLGVHSICKSCRKPISKAYYNKWLKNNAEMRMLCNARSRAKRLGLPFDLVISDIVIPEVCPVLGIDIVKNGGKNNPNTASLDKFVPELGYVRDNIHVISWRANWLKQNASLEEAEKLAAWMRNVNDTCSI